MLQTTSSCPSDFFVSCLRNIKRNHPTLSTAQIAKKLDVSSSTLSRIGNRDVKKPKFDHALSIVRMAFPDEQDYKKILAQHYPEMSEAFSKVYASTHKEAVFVKKEAEPFFEDPTTHEYMLLATSDHGVTEEFVGKRYGEVGLEAINKMVRENILKKEGNKYVLGPVLNAGQTTVHKLLQNLVTLNYDVEAFDRKDNWLSVQYNSVDKVHARKKIISIMRDAYKQIDQVLQSPEYRGEDVVWVGMAMDTLAKETSNMGMLQ